MGTILQGTCPGCGYHAELYTGGGQQDCNPETALKVSRGDPQLAAALKENAWFRIDRRTAICNHCRKFVVAENIIYQKKDGRGRKITGVCPDCGGPLLVWPSENTEGIPCPVCGQPVSLTAAGVWD